MTAIDDGKTGVKDDDDTWYDQDEYYRIYDHSTIWVGILEANATRRKAQAARRVLHANDLGLMQQEARDSSSKIHPNVPMKLLFDSVTLVGHKQSNGNARGMQTHVALVPNLEHYLDTTERLFIEYDIVTSFLRRHYKQSFLPDQYTPFAEFMTFRKAADYGDITKIIDGLKTILRKDPLHIPLRELEFPDPHFPQPHEK